MTIQNTGELFTSETPKLLFVHKWIMYFWKMNTQCSLIHSRKTFFRLCVYHLYIIIFQDGNIQICIFCELCGFFKSKIKVCSECYVGNLTRVPFIWTTLIYFQMNLVHSSVSSILQKYQLTLKNFNFTVFQIQIWFMKIKIKIRIIIRNLKIRIPIMTSINT